MRQTSVFVCEVRAFFVVSCYVCVDRQLESSVVIQGSLGGQLTMNMRRMRRVAVRVVSGRRVRADIAGAKPA